jgi:hypothetical protein
MPANTVGMRGVQQLGFGKVFAFRDKNKKNKSCLVIEIISIICGPLYL